MPGHALPSKHLHLRGGTLPTGSWKHVPNSGICRTEQGANKNLVLHWGRGTEPNSIGPENPGFAFGLADAASHSRNLCSAAPDQTATYAGALFQQGTGGGGQLFLRSGERVRAAHRQQKRKLLSAGPEDWLQMRRAPSPAILRLTLLLNT